MEILFENDDLVAINKPEGLMVHENGHSNEPTVVDWFLSYVPNAKGVGEMQMSQKGEPLERSGVVHRLDKETSGVLLLAKHQDAFVHLKAQFHDRLVHKTYHAFVYGGFKERWGTINRPIGRSAKDFRLRSAQHGARGTLRPSVTNYECLLQGTYEDEKFSYLSLQPETGRTHQIRVHLQAIGRPIVGDMLYAKHEIQHSNNLGLSRLALHAYALKLTLPSGEEHTVEAPLPTAFETAKARIAGV